MARQKKETENQNSRAPTELVNAFDDAVSRLAAINAIEGVSPVFEVIDAARPLVLSPEGLDAIYERVPAIESAGFFGGSDWDYPQTLVPSLAARTVRHGEPTATLVECLSQVRLLAVTKGDYVHASISAEHAHNFLAQVMAMNLDLVVSDDLQESDRLRPDQLGHAVQNLYHYLLQHLGYDNLLEHLVAEVWRILEQRPVQVEGVKHMVTQIAVCLEKPDALGGEVGDDALQLINAVFSPTEGCREDPGFEVYSERLADMDDAALMQEAIAFAQAMHNTGLVSAYMPVFIRYLRGRWNALIPTALGLSYTGADAFHCYPALIHRLIDDAVFPETSQCTYGLAMMLERGILYSPPVAPSLWRQIRMTLCDAAAEKIATVFGSSHSPECFLLADVLNVLGRPLGVGQGNNPSCQSAIGLSMWAANEADYLLQVLTWAARDNEVLSRFEGWEVSSKNLEPGLVKDTPVDVDPVSLILIPHLDRIYGEMWRRCEDRNDDAHRWINPEFYGWWVSHGFKVVADIHTGEVTDYDDFIRHFYASYHPYYNGNIPVIHHQPAGIAVTDSAARFVGRHAITILRVALSPRNEMRVYFFNPNNDSGQDWGQGITCSTRGNGEIRGEASLPVAEFTSRLYVFHYDTLELGDLAAIPEAEVARVMALGYGSWAASDD